jgi:hypothetical protein
LIIIGLLDPFRQIAASIVERLSRSKQAAGNEAARVDTRSRGLCYTLPPTRQEARCPHGPALCPLR